MSKHTPGPWEVNRGDGLFVAREDTESDLDAIAKIYYQGGEELANARLIAAAPDGYELWEKHRWERLRAFSGELYYICPECRGSKEDGCANDCALDAYFKNVEGSHDESDE
jgi:hypothetical protein